MSQNLESPNGDSPDWDSLYLARGSGEVPKVRPIMSGDVFAGVSVQKVNGDVKSKTVAIVQHPCVLRVDGVELSESILVAEVKPHNVIRPEEWKGYGKMLPLPELVPGSESQKKNQAVMFDKTYHVHRDSLQQRIACLTLRGVCLLFQRWVHHSTRVIVATRDIDLVISPAYEEIDILERWCEMAETEGVPIARALVDADAWLRGEFGNITRREALASPQLRSQIRRQINDAVTTSVNTYRLET